jgi:hypothetical protein
MLQEAADMLAQWDSNEPLVTLEPNAAGSYQITQNVGSDLGEPDEERFTEIADNRQIVLSSSMLGRYYVHKQPS